MRKTLLAMALAGVAVAPAVASADTTLYGSVRLSATYTDNNGNDSTSWDVKNQASRLGFKGAEDLGNGLSAIYHYEFGVNAADDAQIGGSEVGGRLSYVGLKGGWGQVALGRQWNPYYFAVGGDVDVFNASDSANGYYGLLGAPSREVADLRRTNAVSTRSGNLVTYISPNWSGFGVQGALEMNGPSGESDVDRWQVSGTWTNGPGFIGIGYLVTQENDNTFTDTETGKRVRNDLTQLGASVRWDIGSFRLAGSVQQVDDNKITYDNAVGYDLLGQYRFGNNFLSASYFSVDDFDGRKRNNGNKIKNGFDGWILGLEHRFSRRSRVYAEYGYNDSGDNDPVTGEKYRPKIKRFSVGMRHDF